MSLLSRYWFNSGSKPVTTAYQTMWPTCLMAMLTLTELMEPSIRTFSLSLRLMITGWRSNSLLLLEGSRKRHKRTLLTFCQRHNQCLHVSRGFDRCCEAVILTVLPPLACCVSPPLARRNSPGRVQPAEWHAQRWDMGARLPSEGRRWWRAGEEES